MKRLKKFMSILLTAIMVLAMCVPVMADENLYAITITNPGAGHTYEAYQIFKGEISDGKLTDIDWGNGVNSFTYKNKTTAQDIANELEVSKSAADFAKEAGNHLATVAGTATVSSDGTCVIGNLQAGYYLVKDKDNTVPEDSSYTNFILKVAGNVTVSTKMDVPTVEKKVKENVKETNTRGEETDTRIPSYKIPAQYNDVADYNIGDHVPFQLIGTMPSNIDSYTEYSYEFVDTLSKGLTYDDNATVKLKNDGNEVKITVTPDFSKDKTTGVTTLKIKFDDIKAVAKANTFTITSDTKVIVDYTATLNADAEIGKTGNENEVYLNFSNNPNGSGKGKTTEDKVIVFTYRLDTEKIDGTDNTKKLKDAQFILKDSTGAKYAKVEKDKFTGWTSDKNEATTLITDKDGLIKVAGLDAGTYLIEETKAPAGYNKLTGDVTIVITATTANGQTWNGTTDAAITKLDVTSQNPGESNTSNGDANVNTGIAKVQIANNSGSTLPSTGGIGTTIFYVVGVILMLGAGVLLVTKKRMSSNR